VAEVGARMTPVADAKAKTVRALLADHVEPGSTVVTDGFASYAPALTDYRQERIVGAKGELPGVHRVAALAKRWLLSTHQGSVDNAHLPSDLNEFCFRFNRRTARHRGLLFLRLLELAVAHDPVRRNDLILGSEIPRQRPPVSGRAGIPPAWSEHLQTAHGAPSLTCATPVNWRP
jgi:transposase-like protein